MKKKARPELGVSFPRTCVSSSESSWHVPLELAIDSDDGITVQTDTRVGLTSEEVLQRRKKYGLNQMKEEKENLILKFLGFFVGPIQFVMEVSFCFVISTTHYPTVLPKWRSTRNETFPQSLSSIATAYANNRFN